MANYERYVGDKKWIDHEAKILDEYHLMRDIKLDEKTCANMYEPHGFNCLFEGKMMTELMKRGADMTSFVMLNLKDSIDFDAAESEKVNNFKGLNFGKACYIEMQKLIERDLADWKNDLKNDENLDLVNWRYNRELGFDFGEYRSVISDAKNLTFRDVPFSTTFNPTHDVMEAYKSIDNGINNIMSNVIVEAEVFNCIKFAPYILDKDDDLYNYIDEHFKVYDEPDEFKPDFKIKVYDLRNGIFSDYTRDYRDVQAEADKFKPEDYVMTIDEIMSLSKIDKSEKVNTSNSIRDKLRQIVNEENANEAENHIEEEYD